MTTISRRHIAVFVTAAAAFLALAAPANAQLSAGRSAAVALSPVEPVQFRDFFRPFWGGGGGYQRNYDPFAPRQQNYEALKPPAPRKVETPPSETVLVIGDTFADWLAYGLEEALADTPQVGIVRKIRPYSGLVRYEARADSPDWAQAMRDVLAGEKPAAIVVMLGLNDRLSLREPAREPAREHAAPHAGAPATQAQGQASGQAQSQTQTQGQAQTQAQGQHAGASTAPAAAEAAAASEGESAASPPNEQHRPPGSAYEFRSDRWGELYAKRIDEMISALKSKGVPILWVGLPSVRGTKSTSDMLYLDELYRARAEKAGIIYVDIWDGFADDQGRYTQQGPDFQGQTRRLRTYDGVNFTKSGAEKLAHYVEHDLRRVLSSHVVPVALPGPEEQAPKGARPTVGPVVPLGALSSGEGGELLGASHPAQKEADPLAARVLGRGEAVAAPPGRADDFSWPRGGDNANAPASDAPAAAKQGSDAGKEDANKPDANKAGTGKSETSQGQTGKNEAGKNENIKNEPKKAGEAKSEIKREPIPAKPRQTQTRNELDGAPPRPPLPVGR